jgi:hypothetical protein
MTKQKYSINLTHIILYKDVSLFLVCSIMNAWMTYTAKIIDIARMVKSLSVIGQQSMDLEMNLQDCLMKWIL